MQHGIARDGVRQSVIARRTFLRLAGGMGVGMCLLVDACSSPSPTLPTAVAPPPTPTTAAPVTAPTTTAPTSVAAVPTSAAPIAPSQLTAATSSGRTLPTYLAVQGVKPDLPPSDAGLQSGYFTYPQSLVRTVSQAPGLGSDVTGFTQTVTQTPPPVEQNAAWQAVNKALNVNLKLQIAASGPDYTTKVATLIAGGDLPDLFYLQSNVLTGGMPAFFEGRLHGPDPIRGWGWGREGLPESGCAAQPAVEADGLRRSHLRRTHPAAEFPVRLECQPESVRRDRRVAAKERGRFQADPHGADASAIESVGDWRHGTRLRPRIQRVG